MPRDAQLGVQLPPYQPAPKFQSEKGNNDMYPFNRLNFNVKDVQNRYKGVLGPLSLFAPYPHEDEQRAREQEEQLALLSKDFPAEAVELERPVTPINDEVKSAPINFPQLAKMVRRRVAAKPEVEHLGVEEQKELSAIIMGEVNNVWPDLRQQVDDPFLTAKENQELQRRITVHIVTVCEQLFVHYLQKAQILNRRGVFSGPANMSRLKAQLALDTNKFLNVLTMRRYIVSDLRAERGEFHSSDEEEERECRQRGAGALDRTGRKPDLPQQPAPALSYKALTAKTIKSRASPGSIEYSRPKSRLRKHHHATTEEDLREMRENMPGLDTSKLLDIVADLPHARPPSDLAGAGFDARKQMAWFDNLYTTGKSRSKEHLLARKTSEDYSREKIVLKKSASVQQLQLAGETLFEELGIDSGRLSSTSAPDAELFKGTPRSQRQEQPTTATAKPEPGSREYAAEDLRRLVGRTGSGSKKTKRKKKQREEKEAEEEEEEKIKGEEDEDDLPPLLQAMTRAAKHDGKHKILDQQLKELEEREAKRREEESIVLREPTHPQPATVSTKLPNKSVVRTSDIRVSERVCLSSVTLNKHTTVYNDLIDEIDAVTMKKLDSNLFLGEEIREVYQEIMKTVPTDHMQLENDELIESSADSVNLTDCLASSSLHGKASERIVNPQLHRDITPPWGDMHANDWAKTPESPPRDMRGRPMIHPMTPKGNGEAMRDLLGDQAKQYLQQDPPDIMQEVMARSYASWLIWWKNTINSDDYMKYLSTQESDYMGVIFHFYDSADEDENDDDLQDGTSRRSARRAKKQAEQGEKDKRLEELRSAKSEFREGFWNVNSVLLGGLGKDPEVEEEDSSNKAEKTAASLDTSQAVRTPHSKTLVISRKSQRSSRHAEDGGATATNTGTHLRTGTRDSDRGVSRHTDFTKSVNNTKATTNTADTSGTSEACKESAEQLTSQDRLERVWASLQMPDAQKLDMAIKYSSDQYHDKLEDAIEDWEQAATLILQRETMVAKLENFERLASDPNRFFEKGYRGSSVARLEEAKIRSTYYKKIDFIDAELKSTLEDIKKDYDDTVTFQGRPYADKMQWDRTEMLYWLQEERKQQALQYETRMRSTEMPMKMVTLDPIARVATPVQ